ncbi:hypothetical protein LTR50_006454 [Elasticomyces elasticus]|nr:hypothetical protein LTR50_006454 [Elasticomyces elasticus]
MTWKEHAGQRHGSTESSGAESWRSQDTIQGPFANYSRGTPMKVETDKKLQLERDSEISPGTVFSKSTMPANPANRTDVAPWEDESILAPGSNDYRTELSMLDTNPSSNVPSISRQPPSGISAISPWTLGSKRGKNMAPLHMPTSVFGSFYDDSTDDLPQLSPGFRPLNGDLIFPGGDRRPSIASATTISSSGSRSSIGRGFQKGTAKLQGFFGEDVNEGRRGSNTSLSGFVPRKRENSVANKDNRPASPTSSRPRTPAPSSEVTPWVFQDTPDLPHAPDVRPHEPQNTRTPRQPVAYQNHRLHLPGHRHHKSTDENKNAEKYGYALRPVTSREESYSNLRRADQQAAMSSTTNLKPRSSSPASSANSLHTRDGLPQRSPAGSHGTKRSLVGKALGKITGRHKDDKSSQDTLKDMPSSTASLAKPPSSATSSAKTPSSAASAVDGRRPAGAPSAPDLRGSVHPPPNAVPIGKKEHNSRLPFKGRRLDSTANLRTAKDPNTETGAASTLWHLDTDMSHMEGIIDANQPPMTPPGNEIFSGILEETQTNDPQSAEQTGGTWDAPDSWAVKRVNDENISRLRELDEAGAPPKDEDPGPMYFMRVFRADSTFAVISAGLNTTAAELIQMMAKKTFLQDELDSYHIVMRKRDSARQLDGGERPLVMQKRLLEMAGYKENDRLEDLGREDHGYLCRFTFLPSKMSGYSSLERDPGFNKMQKFNHIDLQGRNLIAIPITLYQKATEIITLNLSKNLSLDVPKDFIQSCSNLREIKYTSNEAWRLPPSLCLANRLTTLDVSNNRLEQLEHADLHKLRGLLSLKLSNNKLTRLPSYFGNYQALRSLNLSSNSLTEFPDFLCNIRTLKDLDVSFNSITVLPNVSQLVNLERLWATNNKLAGAFPDAFKNLENLQEIDVRFNALDNIDILAELPKLEHLMIGHNAISAFEGSFSRIKVLMLNHNPVTRFGFDALVPTLTTLNLASAKLSHLPDDLFSRMPGITKLNINKNHFATLSPHIGRLSRLEHLSVAKNELSNLPPQIGHLFELRYLDVRENNLSQLPQEIWLARKLETLNVSSNVLADFPKPCSQLPPLPGDGINGATPTPGLEYEELGRLEDFQIRRPSTVSGTLSASSSPSTSSRKGSVVSSYTQGPRKHSTLPRTPTDMSLGTLTPTTRKDSTLSSRFATTFAMSLRHLLLADNRLSDEVFDELALLPELRILNVSYNELYDMPSRTLKRWPHLTELYLSGNDLTSLPSEDLEEGSSLKVLHINSNKFQTLPAELGKVQKLSVLDVGSNMLKYNVSNWPYDWNWNWNIQLRYLNLSGNKRLEIKPAASVSANRDHKDLTDFSSLTKLRILGLMDVTLISQVPEQAPDRRVRTAGTIIGTSIPYGMADSLGRNEHLSTRDMLVPTFRGHEDETLVGMFDGQALSNGGSRIAKYLHEKFKYQFAEELDRLRPQENATDALRRTYLYLNKELATAATQTLESRELASPALLHRGSTSGPELTEDDLTSGSVATVLYLHGMELFVSNVGDAQALLIHSEGNFRTITRKHDPADAAERQRIREAGGFVSRHGKLNDQLEVSRAFGYIQMSPCIIAAPHVNQITIRETDEIILLASRELWDYLTPDFAVDVARSERDDLMRGAQKLRDLAIAFGATGKIMVMMIGVSDLRKREKARFRTHSMSMGPTGPPDDYFTTVRRKGRGRDAVGDSKLARLDQEVDAPQGEVSLVFTDIKNSTMLWETYPASMRSAIKLHNEVMRRHLRIIGGYEVKTEGDAFMVAFPTVTSALLWCFTIQQQLLEVQWPSEILNSVHGQEVLDSDGNIIFRGLSVRMGIHWGRPVCEVDPVTKRMDYFGPMVNRAARISAVADGGQITVSADFIAEIQRMLETHIESDRSSSTGSEETMGDEPSTVAIRRELRSLSSQGFEVKDLGQRSLKGLENPEYIYLMYPHALASRLAVQQQRQEAEAAIQHPDLHAKKTRDSQLTIETDHVWDLWNVSLRLEMLCSSLENTGERALKPPETALLERMRNKGGEITDRFLVNFLEHQISRIETCTNTLALRNMIRPFGHDMLGTACPMALVLGELASQLKELQSYKEQADFTMAPS